MRRFSVLCGALLVAVLVGMMLVSITVGAQQRENPVLAGFVEGCEDTQHACWHGIMPGASIQQMAEVMQQYGYRFQQGPESIVAYLEDCLFSYSYDSGNMHFSGCNDLRVGDVMEVLRQPTLVMGCNFGEAILGYHPYTFFYLKQIISDPLTPYSEVQEFTILGDIGDVDIPPDTWYGFAPFWRYRTLEPDWLVKCLPKM